MHRRAAGPDARRRRTASPTTTCRRPPEPAGTVLVRGPYGRALPVLDAVRALSTRPAATTSCSRACAAPSVPGGEFTPMVARGRRRRRHRRVAARPAVVHRHVRHLRAVLSRVHAVGPADGPAAGAGGRGHHRRPARLQRRRRWGTGAFSLNDFLGWSDMVAHQEDAGRLRSARAPGSCARDGRSRTPRAQVPLGEAGRALLGRGRAVVGVLGRASRARRPVLGAAAACIEALDRVAGAGAADQRLAGPVPRADPRAVPTSARPGRATSR